MAEKYSNIGRTLKNLRVSRGKTQSELAAASGLEQSTISLIERGKTSPNVKVLEKFSDGLGIPLALVMVFATDVDESSEEPDDKLLRIIRESAREIYSL